MTWNVHILSNIVRKNTTATWYYNGILLVNFLHCRVTGTAVYCCGALGVATAGQSSQKA
jgi:hypothetical protein